ncbi:MAG: hypothetical protein WCT49_00130 [Candidatus Paceibacterota bacterium]|jgi:hypothetical protein|nr:hypothetical protein [Candidatus Paceibacterota bacterium]
MNDIDRRQAEEDRRKELERRIAELETENGVLRSLLDRRQPEERRLTVDEGAGSYLSMRKWSLMVFILFLVFEEWARTKGNSIVNTLGPYSQDYMFYANIMIYSRLGIAASFLWGTIGSIFLYFKRKSNKKLIAENEKKYKDHS